MYTISKKSEEKNKKLITFSFSFHFFFFSSPCCCFSVCVVVVVVSQLASQSLDTKSGFSFIHSIHDDQGYPQTPLTCVWCDGG